MSDNKNDKSVSICIATNPLFRLDIISKLIKRDIQDFTELACLQKTVGIFCDESNPNDQIGISIRFKFKGNKRSSELMKIFVRDYKYSFADVTANSDGFINAEELAESFVDYLKYTYIDITALGSFNELADSMKKAVSELYQVCINKVVRNENKQLLYLKYITGSDNILNVFYTVWKYFIIARIGELGGIYKNINGVSSEVHYDKKNEEVRIEVRIKDCTSDKLRCIFTTLLGRVGIFYIMYKMLAGIDFITGIPEPSNTSGVNLLAIMGLEPNNTELNLNSYGFLLPSCSRKNFELRECINSSDYTVLFDAPCRWKEEVSSKLLIDISNYIIKCSGCDDHMDKSLFGNIKPTYMIYTPEWLDEGMSKAVDNHLTQIFSTLTEDSSEKDANYFCNDIMINDMHFSLNNFISNIYVDENDILPNTDYSFSDLRFNISDDLGYSISEQITARDVFTRENIDFNSNNMQSLEKLYKPGGLIAYIKDNGSSNVPQNKMRFEALKFEDMKSTENELQKFFRESQHSKACKIKKDNFDALKDIDSLRKDTLNYCRQINEACNDINEVILKLSDSPNHEAAKIFTEGPQKILEELLKEIGGIMVKQGNAENKFNTVVGLMLGDVDDDVIKQFNIASIKKTLNKYDIQSGLEEVLLTNNINNELDYQVKIKMRLSSVINYLSAIGLLLRDQLRIYIAPYNTIIKDYNGGYHTGENNFELGSINSVSDFLGWAKNEVEGLSYIFSNSEDKIKKPIRKAKI